MDNRPIGVFDSGLGGLSAVKEIAEILPNESIVYFGDTGRVPYGTKSKDTILRYARQDEAFLLSKNVKMIIAACGTVSSVAYSTGEDLGVPFLGVVEPSAQEAVKASKNKKIGVIGTSTTVKSGSYEKAIKSIDENIEVYSVACPLFVSIVEQGWIKDDDEIALLTAKRYLQPLIEKGVDTLILGCTHFPLISGAIAKIMGENVTLISSGGATAKVAAQLLEKNDMLSDGECVAKRYYVSDSVEGFSSTAKLFLEQDSPMNVTQIGIENYGKKD